jgi:Arginine repressor
MSIEQNKRQKLIIEYIKKHPSATQEDIIKHLENLDLFASQATVARDLKDLGYRKVNGKYTKTKEKLESEQESMLRNLIAYDEPRIINSSTEIFQVILSTKRGMEESIANLISNIYEGNIIGTFTGNRCIMILTTKKKNADMIYKTLKSYKKIQLE